MAAARPRPYRRILTSALHRRFVHASALALLVCYIVAFALGEKSSCKYNQAGWSSSQDVLTAIANHLRHPPSLLVMVSNWSMWNSNSSTLSLQPCHLCPACWSDAPWRKDDSLVNKYSQATYSVRCFPDLRMVHVLSLVVQRDLQMVFAA